MSEQIADTERSLHAQLGNPRPDGLESRYGEIWTRRRVRGRVHRQMVKEGERP